LLKEFPILNGKLHLRLGFTLFVLLGCVFLLGLGCWQLERMRWKHELVARITAQMAEPAIDFPTDLSDPSRLEFRRVRLTGRFDHAHEIHLAAREVRFSTYGYHILTPFHLTDGRFVLISRGWVPPAAKDPTTRADNQTEGVLTITGIARIPPPRRWLAPENAPDRNVWLWLDMAAVRDKLSLPQLAPMIVEADAGQDPKALPKGGQTRLNFPDNHLIYAITWFSLALALLIIGILAQWQKRDS
jgi:surfeit locus 1 family protein